MSQSETLHRTLTEIRNSFDFALKSTLDGGDTFIGQKQVCGPHFYIYKISTIFNIFVFVLVNIQIFSFVNRRLKVQLNAGCPSGRP